MLTQIVGSPSCWPTIGSCHPVCPNNSGFQALGKMKRWIKTCKSEHTLCAKKKPLFLPRRLIEISENSHVKLVEPEDPCSYVALSYCWGTQREAWLRTLKSNIVQHQQSIDKEQLPQALLDAILLTRALGFRFIWIDALCIIQDDSTDLNSELVCMGNLYACADLVIGVDTTSDCTQSLKTNHAFARSINYNQNGSLRKQTFQTSFNMKPPLSENDCFPEHMPYEPYFLKSINKAKPVTLQDTFDSQYDETNRYKHQQSGLLKLYVRENKAMSHENHSIKTYWKNLDNRCWTLQESRLASRFLTLGLAEMKWRCVESSFCECYESSTEFKRENNFVELSPVAFRRQETITQQIERKQIKLFSMLTIEDKVKILDRGDLFEAWELLISDFSKRKISSFGDRLPAMSGVMTIFNRELSDSNTIGDSSFVGLWKQNILKGMLWRSIIDGERPAEFYCRSITAPETTRIEQSVLLKHFRLDSLLKNLFVIHAYACGKPCFASSIYWPMLNEKPKTEESWPTDNVPSWSWLSVVGPVKYWEWLHGSSEMLELQTLNQLKFVPDAHVLHAYSWPSSGWKDIPCGEIRLRCRLAPVKLKSVLHGNRDPHFDFYDLYRTANFDEDGQTLPFLIPPLLQSFTHFVCIENSPALMQFIPDTPCVFGGNDPSDQAPIIDDNQWLIDLINQEYQSLLQCRTRQSSDSGAHLKKVVDTSPPDLDYDFHKFMPCIPSQQLAYTMSSNTMCMSHDCGCGKRWTNTMSYPVKAAYIGSCQIDGESGRRTVQRFSLILMPSLHSKKKAYHRIGIAIFKQQAELAGYHDPFKNTDWEEVSII